jgi:hypothetical protein
MKQFVACRNFGSSFAIYAGLQNGFHRPLGFNVFYHFPQMLQLLFSKARSYVSRTVKLVGKADLREEEPTCLHSQKQAFPVLT